MKKTHSFSTLFINKKKNSSHHIAQLIFLNTDFYFFLSLNKLWNQCSETVRTSGVIIVNKKSHIKKGINTLQVVYRTFRSACDQNGELLADVGGQELAQSRPVDLL